MTIKELAELLNISINTLRYSFPRTQKNFLKRGVIIKKRGRGESAIYTVKYVTDREDS